LAINPKPSTLNLKFENLRDIASNVSHEAFGMYIRAREKLREEEMVRRQNLGSGFRV
jgi:hypothetical protein